MNKYILVNKNKLFSFSEKYGYTAAYINGEWCHSKIPFMALLSENDPNIVQISETEAMVITSNSSPDEYFEDKQKKCLKDKYKS